MAKPKTNRGRQAKHREPMASLSAYIPAALVEKVKARANTERTVSQVVTQLLTKALDEEVS